METVAYFSLFEHRAVRGVVFGLHCVTMAIVALSFVLDIAYLFKSTYASQGLYIAHVLAIASRFMAPFLIALIDIFKKVSP